MKTNILKLCLALAWLAFPAGLQAQFTFTTNNNQVTITDYTGTSLTMVIPPSTNGHPVVAIGTQAFTDSVTNAPGRFYRLVTVP